MADELPDTDDTSPPPARGVRAVVGRAQDLARDAGRRIEDLADRVPLVRTGLDLVDDDRVAGGSVLAAALAFRMFLMTLPLTVLSVAALGFAQTSDPSQTESIARSYGMRGVVAASVQSAAVDAARGRWVLLLLGLVSLVLVARPTLRTLVTVHALAWREPPPRVRSTVRSLGGFLVMVVVALVVAAVAAWLREAALPFRVAGFAGSALLFAVLWFVAALLLPHGEARPGALVPGALLVGVGFQIYHLVTVIYLAPRIDGSSQLYGALGAAVVILTGYYLLGRLIIGAAVLNASLWRRGRADWLASVGDAVALRVAARRRHPG